MNNYPAMTVNELLTECQFLVQKGLGDYKILISQDDEGNGYHGLFYTFTTNHDDIDMCRGLFHDNNVPNNVVLLG